MIRRLLLIEDNIPLTAAIRRMVKQHDDLGHWEVTVVHTIDSAMSAVQEFDGTFDFIIVDGHLKGSESYQTGGLIQWIRAQGYSGPLAAMSGRFNSLMIKDGCDHAFEKSGDLHITIPTALRSVT